MIYETTYRELLLTAKWKKKRKEILHRDKGCCRNCGSDRHLQVHHRQYNVDAKSGLRIVPWDYPNRLLITLCDECHTAGHHLYFIPSIKQ